MKYTCTSCNYSTDDQANFNKHKKSKKHNNNCNKVEKTTRKNSLLTPERLSKDSEKLHSTICKMSLGNEINILNNNKYKYTCENCNISFTKSCNLSRHLKNCKLKNVNQMEKEYEIKIKEQEYQNKLKLLEEKINSYEAEKTNLISKCNILESKCNILENENDFHKQLISAAGGMLQKSMNTMTYLLLNHNEAPQLRALPDYSIISKNSDTLVKDLIHYHNKGAFDKYIGDFIVRQYKKNDPDSQALWSSDTERLNYFIREFVKHKNNQESQCNLNLIGQNNKLKWIIDKKGIKVNTYIIEPLLEYILNIGNNYINKINEKITTLDNNESWRLVKDMQAIGEISSSIKNKSLVKDINKYIAPHFFLNKENKDNKENKEGLQLS